ncbi:hypothetical protein LPW36_06840 [Jinshanibacter sp. LJY008]|uniref:Lecithin:cholesterol acyltransferase n=1 Tax=Limnobaculum eriocheiris TaxID=2897391 RepID=A0A9X1MVI5_9GAMM|nr:hypothetical protein [Limnobaculum eriocheiris]MCD1125724.1 hypothetical protein [Limnobaculum eriocheiris]
MPLNWGYSYARSQSIAYQLRKAGLGGEGKNLPVVYLSGILGSKLYDRQEQAQIWGDYRGVFFHKPHYAGYEYEDSEAHRARVFANGHLHEFTIVSGLVHTLVTAELKQVLQTGLGYKEGQDLFFLAHDWRADLRSLASRLDAEFARLRARFGDDQKIILMGQSIANLAIRYWLRVTTSENREMIAKWYAFGPPWQGTYHALSMMETGYYPGTRLFHGFSADDVTSYPSTYQLLPSQSEVVDIQGKPLTGFDIYNPECWQEYRMGPYRVSGVDISPVCQRAREQLGQNLQKARELAASIKGSSTQEQAIPQVWFLSDNNTAVKTAVYDGHRWYLETKTIQRDIPQLVSQVLEQGDDHLPLSGLLSQRCGPVIRNAHHQPWGESFVYISKARTHRALINHTPNLRSLAFDLAVEREKIKNIK